MSDKIVTDLVERVFDQLVLRAGLFRAAVSHFEIPSDKAPRHHSHIQVLDFILGCFVVRLSCFQTVCN